MNKAAWMSAGAGAVIVLGMLAGGAAAQSGGGGTATYWMTADTMSGMGGMMAGGGRRAIMGAMMGRGAGNGFVRNLHLQLGSGARPAGEPSAEHDVPPGLQVGPSLPLVSPRQVAATSEPGPTEWPTNVERPRGRILIYWGCGEHVRPGQPVVIDFATIQSGRMPPAFANMNFHSETPPSASRFATYGEWPNQRNGTRVPDNGSLVGDHVVRGNYSPEIHFTLAPGQDFLAPVTLVSNGKAPSGSVPVAWQPIGGARAWFAGAMGAGQNGDMVIWSSAESQTFAMAMDYLPDGEIARLVQQRVLMPGMADRCTVPAEVAQAGQGMMYTLTAFGGETNFSHPLRPARAPAGWHPDWTVKFRSKSAYMGLLGMNMNEMMGGHGAEQSQNGQNGQNGEDQGKRKKHGLLGGLGGMIPH
jgi:hypothetical protein